MGTLNEKLEPSRCHGHHKQGSGPLPDAGKPDGVMGNAGAGAAKYPPRAHADIVRGRPAGQWRRHTDGIGNTAPERVDAPPENLAHQTHEQGAGLVDERHQHRADCAIVLASNLLQPLPTGLGQGGAHPLTLLSYLYPQFAAHVS